MVQLHNHSYDAGLYLEEGFRNPKDRSSTLLKELLRAIL